MKDQQVPNVPVLPVEHRNVRLAVSVEVAHKEFVIPAHVAPARQLPVKSAHSFKSASGAAKHGEIGHGPVRSVKHKKVLHSIAIEISYEELIAWPERIPDRGLAE